MSLCENGVRSKKVALDSLHLHDIEQQIAGPSCAGFLECTQWPVCLHMQIARSAAFHINASARRQAHEENYICSQLH